MANPTEITNIILVEITNITEITNTIIEVLDKIDIVDITQPIVWYENFTFWGMLVTMVSAFLMWLSVLAMKKQNEQMRQQYEDEKEERLLRYDRESIQKFIDTYLTIPKLDELKEYSDEEKKDFFYNILIRLTQLEMRVSYTKYGYLSAYIKEIISYLDSRYEEGNKYFHSYCIFLLLSINEITKYMYIGEEVFNTVWEKDFETIKNGLNEGIEDYIKRNETKTP